MGFNVDCNMEVTADISCLLEKVISGVTYTNKVFTYYYTNDVFYMLCVFTCYFLNKIEGDMAHGITELVKDTLFLLF